MTFRDWCLYREVPSTMILPQDFGSGSRLDYFLTGSADLAHLEAACCGGKLNDFERQYV
jgi:hypothetical protein